VNEVVIKSIETTLDAAFKLVMGGANARVNDVGRDTSSIQVVGIVLI
jgi:hypothetical protein